MVLDSGTHQRRREALAAALGPRISSYLASPDTLEIFVNSDGSTWLDSRSRGLRRVEPTIAAESVAPLLTTISGLLGQELTATRPVLESEIPFDGSRITALLPPVVAAPSLGIRKRAAAVYRLADYIATGILPAPTADALRRAVAPPDPALRPLNLLLAGGPGSGKTTLANALLAEIGEAPEPVQRLILIEDAYELQCTAPCHEIFRTTDELDLRYLVRRALRYRPDRIIVGEVRGPEALDLLKAWNTGTPGGLTTVHANSALDALDRLDQLSQEAGVRSAARLVASAVDLVAFIVRTTRGRRVTELLRVHGLTPEGAYDVTPCLEETS